MSNYGDPEYWEKRYKDDPDPYDWYQTWSNLSTVLSKHISKDDNILMLGCGTSNMTEEMHDAGYRNILSIDISKTAVELMKPRLAAKKLECRQMDATKMTELQPAEFNVVLDKGTLDTIMCGDECTEKCRSLLLEVSRVLSPGGKYICITYGVPAYRTLTLKRDEYNWNVDHESIKKPELPSQLGISDNERNHYIYICTKSKSGDKANESSAAANQTN